AQWRRMRRPAGEARLRLATPVRATASTEISPAVSKARKSTMIALTTLVAPAPSSARAMNSWLAGGTGVGSATSVWIGRAELNTSAEAAMNTPTAPESRILGSRKARIPLAELRSEERRVGKGGRSAWGRGD